MATLRAAAGTVVLENAHVRVEVDPAAGGAVTRMVHKQAVTLPFIAQRGAQVAGIGRFFVPVVAVGDRQVDLSQTKLTPRLEGTKAEQTLTLTGRLNGVAGGLSVERTIRLGAAESGVRIRDVYRGDKAVTLRVGATSRQDGQEWNLNLRCWFGDRSYGPWRFTPYHAGKVDKRTLRTKRIYWRMVSQYGVGMLYQATAPAAPVEMVHRLPEESGNPAAFQWLSGPVAVEAGGTVAVDSAVLIDEGARAGGGAGQLANTDRVVVTLDVPSAGRTGRAMDCAVTVASAMPRKVRLAVSEHRVLIDWGKARTKPAAGPEMEMTLQPGLAGTRSFQITPKGPGLHYVTVAVLDEAGRKVTESQRRAVIDGKSLNGKGEFGATWRRFTQRLPEVRLSGTWERIGRQLGERKLLKRPRDGGSAKRLAFHEKRFPYYASLLRGAAAAMNVPPARLAGAELGPAAAASASASACMGLIVNGPDGPIHLYSKERSGRSNRGMGYVKVVPDKGYRYHMYTLIAWSFGYGVNEMGLATSGASINCDERTNKAGKAHARKRAEAGGMVAPIGTHMMMATCKNVDEAVAFIRNPEAPLSFTGNMLISDATGKAVVLNSVGTYHQIIPVDGRKRFAMGNYPLRRADGLFDIGPNWGWAANTMLREHRVGRYLKRKGYQVTLRDAFEIMGDPGEPGNMNQHIFDNVGLLHSTSAVIAVARTGDLYISNGPPDRVEYVRYRLKD